MAGFTLVTNQSIIARNAGALYGASVGTTNMASYVTQAGTNPDVFLNLVYTNSVSTASTSSVADVLVTNLGITDAAAAATAKNYIVGQLNAVAYTARGAVVNSILNLFSGLTSDATFGAAATAWNTKVTNAVAYATVSGNGDTTFDIGGAPSVIAQTYTLTVGADNFTGTSSNNLFDGSVAFPGGVKTNTIGNADSIDGGAGTDTLFVQLLTAATPASVKNVEILSVESQAGVALDLINGDASLTTLTQANSAAATTVNNIGSALTTINHSSTAFGLTATILAAKLSGTTDALALNISGVTAGTVSIAPNSGTNGYETINISSTGSVANVLTNLTEGATANTLATINVTGSNNLNLGTALDNSVTKVDATAFTGKLTVTTGTSIINVIGGTNDDTINLDGTYTTADTINGGSGTDTLRLSSAQAVVTTAQSNVTNIEAIRVGDALNGALNLTYFGAGAVTAVLDTTAAATAVTGAASTVIFAAGTDTLTINNDDTAHTLGVTISGSATTDVLNLNLQNADLAAALTTTGAETVNLKSTVGSDGTAADAAANTATAITMTATAANETLVITGDAALTLTGAFTADTINASAFTGALTMAAATVATGGAAITGGTGADTLFGSTSADIIAGGAGIDRIIGQSSQAALVANQSDVLTGGAGADTFVFADTLAAAATVSNATNGSIVKITDFVAGTDKIALIDLTGAATSITLATAQTISTAANVAAVSAGISAIAASAHGGAASAVVVTVSAGAAAGTYLYVNDAAGAVSATNDILIDITGISGTLTTSDFLFA